MEPKRADPIKEKPKMISMLRKYVYDDVSERREVKRPFNLRVSFIEFKFQNSLALDAIKASENVLPYFQRIDKAESNAEVADIAKEYFDRHIGTATKLELNLAEFGKHRVSLGGRFRGELVKTILRIRVDIAEVRKISKRFVGALACLRAILTEGVRTSIVKNTHPGQEGQDFCYIRAAIDLPELGIVSAFIGVKKFTDKEFTVYYPYVEGHYAYTAKEKNLKKEGASFKYTFDGRLLFENR
mgnify:CR=1 FL=1